MRFKFDKPKKFISLNKIKIGRGYSYISVFGIPFLVARELSKMFPKISWVFLFIAAIVGIWTVGHLDYKKGLWGNELEFSLLKNPAWVSLLKRIENLEKSSEENKNKEEGNE